YFALFYAEENQFSEIVYSARFLSWFWLAATLRRVDLEPAFWERLAKSFWIGATSQCAIAVWGTFWGLRNGLASTYSNVEATTGAVDVSGKTVVAFVVLGIALSTYWFLTKRRLKLVYAATALAGTAVVLFSYNRASQLGLAVAYGCVLLACLHKKRFKAALSLMGILLSFGVFICSSYGSRFATRWETVVSDKGSGRVAMIEIAGECLADPPSSGVFWFGRGVFQMQEMMYEEIGTYIGMHNDALDFAIAYGVAGAALCVWAICSVLNFRKRAPKYSIERYFMGAASVFVVLTGLCTGMFQATYVYFMLISTLYYWVSQARVKQELWMRGRWESEAAWNEVVWRETEIDDEEEEEEWEDGAEFAAREEEETSAPNESAGSNCG
ncbi:MAG: O-antigen ligase family protein, partial [Thermoguttaceae bacterium]|nr:O-antigen ligase family protein [Thermoguttaceae bacterium]